MPVLTRWWRVDFAGTDAAGRRSQLPYKGSSHAVPRTGSPEPSTAGQCALGRQEVAMRPRVSRLAPWARGRRLNSICSRMEDGSNQACQHLSRRQHGPSAQGNTAAADKTVEIAATEHGTLHAARCTQHSTRRTEQVVGVRVRLAITGLQKTYEGLTRVDRNSDQEGWRDGR